MHPFLTYALRHNPGTLPARKQSALSVDCVTGQASGGCLDDLEDRKVFHPCLESEHEAVSVGTPTTARRLRYETV
jgi:hypothetical protein